MVTYQYNCELDGPTEIDRPMGEATQTTECPVCHQQAQTSISMETPMHVIFCEKFTHKKVRAIVRQIHHLVGRERFENSSIDMRWSDGRAKAQDLFD